MRIIFTSIIMLFSLTLVGQNGLEKIKTTREKTLKEIDYANQLLRETQGKTKESLNEINLINHKLKKRKEYLVGLEVEVNVINEAIERNLQDIVRTEYEINRIKKIYALMIVNLYKKKTKNYQGVYFLASDNLNQLYKRIHTVKLYNSFLRKQRLKFEDLKEVLVQKNSELQGLRSGKDKALNQTRKETITIQQEVNDKNKMVKQLQQKQKQIEEEIRNKEKTARKLENELKKYIEAERKKAKVANKEMVTPADKIISGDFEKNNGKLPWPTQRGIITGKYGEHAHPDYKNVMVRNDGIYISTTSGEKVRSIFKGVVSRVFKIPGENYTVIVKHGQYFSLYHNMIDVVVKQGQTVNIKDVIGTVFTDVHTKETILYFQIWKETEKRDPELWLAPL